MLSKKDKEEKLKINNILILFRRKNGIKDTTKQYKDEKKVDIIKR